MQRKQKEQAKLDQIAKIKLVNFVTNSPGRRDGEKRDDGLPVTSGYFWPTGRALGLGQWGCLAILSLVVAVLASCDLAAAASVAFYVVHALHLSRSCQVSPEPEP